MRQVKYALRCTCGAEFVAEETQDFAVLTPHIDRHLEKFQQDHQFCDINARAIQSLQIDKLHLEKRLLKEGLDNETS